MPHDWSIIAAEVSRLLSAGARSPYELAALEPSAAEQLMASADCRFAVRDFWRAARINASADSSADPPFLAPNDGGSRAFRRAIRRHHKELSRDPHDASACTSRNRLPDNYGRLGPMARIREIHDSRKDATLFGRFIHDRKGSPILTGYLIRAQLLRSFLRTVRYSAVSPNGPAGRRAEFRFPPTLPLSRTTFRACKRPTFSLDRLSLS